MNPGDNASALRIVQDRSPEVKIGKLAFWIQRMEEIETLAKQAERNIRRWKQLADEFTEDKELQSVAFRRGRSDTYASISALEIEIQRLLKSLGNGGEA